MIDSRNHYYGLVNSCEHSVATIPAEKLVPTDSDPFADSQSAVCEHCGTHLGWYCPDNDKHTCEYESGDECCVHCGYPEERK
ncbi:hypothetical protein PLUTO_00470 [Luteibacter phage vB_LflM-Pluto]|uniref:Uncharacterized protein n=1 Tax=Luteibacter phage vB_LflM-Pluto TaxID=2948611 RepID=A0A9E7MTR9_9CAUD|nr:hypothetical protein PLUTO_00470 [Luteibacter phage vB_LflM-Pluto]